MKYDQIKNRIAPCGLNCEKCFAYKNGDIVEYSKRLKTSLGGFDVYAERFVDLFGITVLNKYSDFEEVLNYFSYAKCTGCRNEGCKLIKNCKVRTCSQRKGSDYCFQCSDFPCNDTGFDDHLNTRSVNINKRMGKIGVEKYYEEVKNKPRY